MARVVYRSEQIRHALTELVAQDGNVARTVRVLNDDENAPHPEQGTLRKWRDEFTELYAEIERTHAQVVEQEITSMLRTRVHRAAEIEGDMLEKIADSKHDLPQALRAVTDVRHKSVDSLMKLTGRDKDSGRTEDLTSMVSAMEAKGIVKLTVNLEKEPPKQIDADAEVSDG